MSTDGTAVGGLVGRRILFVNWRDHTHPQAGGAEVYCEEIARRFAAEGAEVTLFTSRSGDAAVTERSRGVRYVRRGRTFDVYVRAAAYMREQRHHFDAVIDFQNGIPFFAPLFVSRRTATVCVIHHVHQKQFALHFPAPVAAVGRLLEGPAARLVYGLRPVVAVSPSTRESVRRLLGLRGPIHVVPNGLRPRVGDDGRAPAVDPTITLVTRLVPQKRIDLLVRAVATLRARVPGLRLEIAGAGPAEAALRTLIDELGVSDAVTLHGFVTDQVRDDLWRRSWLSVVPSEREGWGLTVLEANQWGVPCVAFDVPGLRDAVLDGTTGWLVKDGTDLADIIESALQQMSDPEAALSMSERCRAWSDRFSWDESASRLADVVMTEMDRNLLSRSRRSAGDQATLAQLEAVDGNAADDLEKSLRRRLRRTDLVWRGGHTFRVLLPGSDETEAAGALQGLAGVQGMRLRVAGPADLLTGPTKQESA